LFVHADNRFTSNIPGSMRKITIGTIFILIALNSGNASLIYSQSNNPWLGRWEWCECWPMLYGGGANCVDYVINIKQQENKAMVNLVIQGYQSDWDIIGEGRIFQDSIQIIYSDVRKESLKGVFKKGDVLLELSMRKNKVLTTWKELKPDLDEHQKPGAYFKKPGKGK
jgi:hypothetical protein